MDNKTGNEQDSCCCYCCSSRGLHSVSDHSRSRSVSLIWSLTFISRYVFYYMLYKKSRIIKIPPGEDVCLVHKSCAIHIQPGKNDLDSEGHVRLGHIWPERPRSWNGDPVCPMCGGIGFTKKGKTAPKITRWWRHNKNQTRGLRFLQNSFFFGIFFELVLNFCSAPLPEGYKMRGGCQEHAKKRNDTILRKRPEWKTHE